MGRYSPRRSRSPPRRRPYDDPRERSSRRPSPAPTGLLVRNIPLDARSEDLRIPFERFGPVKDVYLPKNYYTGEPRGFGFVKFRNPEDAAEAKYQLNHTLIGGREIAIVFAEENRKTPQEMRTTSRGSGRYGGTHRRRSPPRSPRRRYHSYSRSPSPRRDFRDGGKESFPVFGWGHYSFCVGIKSYILCTEKYYYTMHRGREDRHARSRSRSISRSPSVKGEKYSRRSRSPREAERSPHERRGRKSDRSPIDARNDKKSPIIGSRSPSPRVNGQIPPEKAFKGSDHRSPSPKGGALHHTNHRSHSPSRP